MELVTANAPLPTPLLPSLSTPTLSDVLNGQTILVTGGAGFLGSAVLLRLLQTPSLAPKRVVAIIRGDDPARRLPPSLQPLVAKISREGTLSDGNPLVVLRGDVSVVGLGLDAVATNILDGLQVDIVLHCAADVKFLQPIKVSIRANTGMAYAMAEFSATTPSVKTHIQVSSCYTGCFLPHNSVFREELVPTDSISFGEQINTYTKAKCVAEGIVNSFARAGTDVAWAVVRMSTVTPALAFPVPMWGSNTTGSPLCAVLAAQPLPESMYHAEAHLDCVPVDLCTNQLLGLTVATHLSIRQTLPRPAGETVPVYHIASTNSVIPVSLYNSVSVKISKPFITPQVLEPSYRPMLSKVVAFDTARTRAALGMEVLGLSAEREEGKVNMTGLELDSKVGFERVGGVEKYLGAVRDAMEVAAKEKRRRKALAARAKL